MSYYTLQKILKRPTEKYYLQKLTSYKKEHHQLKDEVGNIIKKDDVGNVQQEWEDIQELHGVIQHKQSTRVETHGEDSKLRYKGIFTPDFDLETNELSNYRIRFERDYETLYLYILKYDANNYVRDKQNHISLTMDTDRKYFGQQE